MDSDYFPSCTYLLAQQLNNSAARCIEIGHYGRAMSSLKKALEINKKNKKQQTNYKILEKNSTCYHMTLDGCIAYSEKNRSAASALQSSSDDGPNSKRRKIESSDQPKERRDIFWRPPSKCCSSNNSNSSSSSNNTMTRQDLEDDYIYCQPIRVDFQAGDMGGTLFLIIIFNLALAHHLEALGAHNMKRQDTIVRKTLSLYELTHRCYLKLLGKDNKNETETSSWVSGSSVASFRFNMIIQNNISQLHRLVNDYSKYDLCRQHLLSSVMVVLDYNTRVKSGSNSDSSYDPRAMEIEGFLTNTTSLILGDKECAEAA